ncbi:MAG: hypothetical protein IJ274_10405, partial [Lachnospiraceae bacterium]|nr:hypothetical protein [Lachnospiraceae bacterium]
MKKRQHMFILRSHCVKQCYPEHFVFARDWGRAPTSQKKAPVPQSAVQVFFRVCGYKDIACQYGFVYT